MLPLCRRGILVNHINDSSAGDRKVTILGSAGFQFHLKLGDNFNYVLNPIKVPAEWESWKKRRRAAGSGR
jgi:hypothetical protein